MNSLSSLVLRLPLPSDVKFNAGGRTWQPSRVVHKVQYRGNLGWEWDYSLQPGSQAPPAQWCKVQCRGENLAAFQRGDMKFNTGGTWDENETTVCSLVLRLPRCEVGWWQWCLWCNAGRTWEWDYNFSLVILLASSRVWWHDTVVAECGEMTWSVVTWHASRRVWWHAI